MEKKILILRENNHYITPYNKDWFFLNIHFSLNHNISVFASIFFFSIITIYIKTKKKTTTKVHTTVPQQYSVLLGENKMLKYKYQ